MQGTPRSTDPPPTHEATWNGAVLARGDDTRQADGYIYFRPEDVDMDKLSPSDHRSVCGWKGTASYFDIEVDGRRLAQAAWTYASAKPEAAFIEGRIAFWKGVEVH